MPAAQENSLILTKFSVYALEQIDFMDGDSDSFVLQFTEQVRLHLAGGKGTFLRSLDTNNRTAIKGIIPYISDAGLKEMLLLIDRTISKVEETMLPQ